MKKMLFVLATVFSVGSLQAREQANYFTCEGDDVALNYSATSKAGIPYILATVEGHKYSATKRDEVQSERSLFGEVVYLTDFKQAMVDGPTYQIGLIIPFHQLGNAHEVQLKTYAFKTAGGSFRVPNIPLQLEHIEMFPVTCRAQMVQF